MAPVVREGATLTSLWWRVSVTSGAHAHTIAMRPIKHVRGDPLAKRQRCAWAGDAMAGTPRTQTHSCDVRLLKTSAEAPE